MPNITDNIDRTICFIKAAQIAIKEGRTNEVGVDLMAAKAEMNEAVNRYDGKIK